MVFEKWRYLQLFAGEGEGSGESAATGEGAPVPGEQALRELGVPEHILKIRANRPKRASVPVGSADESIPQQPDEQKKEPVEQAAAAQAQTEEKTEKKAEKISWDELMKDPEYNAQMQSVVQARLRSAKGAEEALKKLAPALEVLARSHNMDPANIDYEALSNAINNDTRFYEDMAVANGTTTETAMQMDQESRDEARRKRQEQETLQEQKTREHYIKLQNQGEEMKKLFPGFDLQKEMQNETFARMTSPFVGMSVEDAYHAVHRKELQAAAMQVTAQKTAEQISNSIQSGARRPSENGASGQASSVTSFDYRAASKEQREALRREIRMAAAQGRKVYPNYGK